MDYQRTTKWNGGFLLVLLVSAAWARWGRPGESSILGVKLGTPRAEILRRFPDSRNVEGFSFSGGEGSISDALGRYRRCLSLGCNVTVAFDKAGEVEAIEGPQLELDGRVVLNGQNLNQASRFLGKPIYGSSSDATYFSYDGGVVTRWNLHEASFYLRR